MAMLFLVLIGCVSFHNHIEAGWIAGPVEGDVQHGGMALFTISMTIDEDFYSIGGGGQVWGADGTPSFASTVGADVWTEPMVDAPFGLRAQGQLLIPIESPIFLPLGIAVRGGPYWSVLDDDVRVTLSAHGQLSVVGHPLVNGGAMAGIRWPTGALLNVGK
ncbi:MAG: hypothetical protein AAFV53_34030 [Myxococcota bacterium]